MLINPIGRVEPFDHPDWLFAGFADSGLRPTLFAAD
jgi:hypothetical protein